MFVMDTLQVERPSVFSHVYFQAVVVFVGDGLGCGLPGALHGQRQEASDGESIAGATPPSDALRLQIAQADGDVQWVLQANLDPKVFTGWRDGALPVVGHVRPDIGPGSQWPWEFQELRDRPLQITPVLRVLVLLALLGPLGPFAENGRDLAGVK
uniref:Transmembrane protein n=1 Tax=Steinernema glaseri TaxID=37863 RepID=A0A1I7ZCU7_9BILA